MKQLPVNPELIVAVKFTGAASLLKPTVFKQGDVYCCALGPDPLNGVFGCGDTAEDALADWDETLQLRLKEAGESDPVVKHVKEVLSAQPMPAYLKEFYGQFKL